MRRGWKRVSLSELLTKRTDFTPIEDGISYRCAGIQRSGWGIIERDPFVGGVSKFTKLMRLERDNFVYRVITAFEAPSAVVDYASAGLYVSPQTFPVFRVNETLILPAYLKLLTTATSFHHEMAERCTGSVLRRMTLSVSSLLSIPINLPPLEEQQRIVDLIGSLEDAIEAADTSSTSTNATLRAHLSKLFENDEQVSIDQLAAIQVGFAFKSRDFKEKGVKLLRGDNVTPNGLRWDKAVHIASEDVNSRIAEFALELGDIVIAMDRPVISTGAKVCIIAHRDLPALLVQRVARLRVVDPLVREGICLALKSDNFQQFLSRVQTGAHAPHITKSNVQDFSIPKTLLDSTEIVLLRALNSQAIASSTYAASLRTLRSELLTVLLSGEHEIPASYDALLGSHVGMGA